ncbi:DoxX family protein [Acinetobacter baumannii]|uniref:DoxX family protein n=1 Tax=Acinetobacter baumannii TaxID=470 RepID=UPI00233FB21E|nr:DoxX family protein [Acinetobacter baumannii]MDC4414436.1 DoxX family protein [Acinetobacter baumannii]MDH2520313.1 DoxX family protein [Acinetobacter baumannii]MDK2200812.1 DoxX family protein [Acinetobacter baumannii]
MDIRYKLFEQQRDALILLSRLLILLIFLYFGWTYLTDHAGFVKYLKSVNAPIPEVTSLIAAAVEFFGGILLLIGFWTRPLALLFAFYTVGTGIIGHAFWNASTPIEHHTLFVHFIKNISIAAGFLMLSLLGPGKYSIDGR